MWGPHQLKSHAFCLRLDLSSGTVWGVRGQRLGYLLPFLLPFAAMTLSSFRSALSLSHQGLHCSLWLPLALPTLGKRVKDSSTALCEANTSFLLESQMIQKLWRLGGNRAPTNAHNMVAPMPTGGRQPGKAARA